MRVRRMTNDDLDAVLAIEKVSFPEAWVRRMFEAEMEGPISNAVVAVVDDRVIGYALYRVILDEAHLMNFALAAHLRRQGLGRKLLAWLVDDSVMQGAEKMFLEVRPSNVAACGLYASFGFRTIDVRKRYYVDNEDALVMLLLMGPAHD